MKNNILPAKQNKKYQSFAQSKIAKIGKKFELNKQCLSPKTSRNNQKINRNHKSTLSLQMASNRNKFVSRSRLSLNVGKLKF